jgi:hypothetical protein
MLGKTNFSQGVAAARSTGLRLLHFSTPNSFGVVSLQVSRLLQNCNDWQDNFFCSNSFLTGCVERDIQLPIFKDSLR